MTTETTEKDLVEEVEELLAKARLHALYNRETHKNRDVTELVCRLKDEVKALRAHVVDLNHDMEASNQHCEEYHYEQPVE